MEQLKVYLSPSKEQSSGMEQLKVYLSPSKEQYLRSGTAQGLLESLKRAVQYMRLEDWKTKIIGFGCDAASANVA